MKSWSLDEAHERLFCPDDFSRLPPWQAPLFQSPQKLFGVHGSAAGSASASPSATDSRKPLSLVRRLVFTR